MNLPLEGIRVLDFTHVISGPYCSMLLADLGAEVIKIEKPGDGEFYRGEGVKNENGVSVIYPNYNRNKKGLTLNIKSPRAREILLALAAKSDVFVENQRPGLLNKLGLGYEDMRKAQPKIVYAAISGFGATGPYAKKPAFDMTVAAISGLMSLNGLEGTVPTKTGVAFSDFISGIYAALGIVAALRKAAATGEGAFIDVGMMDSIVSVLDAFIPQYALTGKVPPRSGNRRAGFAPANVFPARDGYVYVAASFQAQWEALAGLMGREDLLADPRFATTALRKEHEPEVEAVVARWIGQYPSEEAVALLEGANVPCAPVKNIGEVVRDEHVVARESIVSFDYPGIGRYAMAASPIRVSGTERRVERAPLLGEHTAEILNSLLGCSAEDIDRLRSEKAV